MATRTKRKKEKTWKMEKTPTRTNDKRKKSQIYVLEILITVF
jgi:hypothetical protein